MRIRYDNDGNIKRLVVKILNMWESMYFGDKFKYMFLVYFTYCCKIVGKKERKQ